MAKYRSFTHVERLSSESCDGILDNDTVFVTAKVDGTNTCVFNDNGKICAGSRTRNLTLEDDNAGFLKWLLDTEEPNSEAMLLKEFLKNNPNYIIYGEWMGVKKFTGAIKYYSKAAHETLFIFDVFDLENDCYMSDDEWRNMLSLFGLSPYFVELLAVLNHPSVDDVLEIAKNNKFMIDDDNLLGEGVVCKARGWKNKYGKSCYGKLVLDEYKKLKKKSYASSDCPERDIIFEYVTDSEIDKSIAKMLNMCNDDSVDINNPKHIGIVTSLTWKDLLTECPNFVKKFKNPTINFDIMNKECKQRVLDYINGLSS